MMDDMSQRLDAALANAKRIVAEHDAQVDRKVRPWPSKCGDQHPTKLNHNCNLPRTHSDAHESSAGERWEQWTGKALPHCTWCGQGKQIVAEHDATEYDAWKCSECGLKNVYYRKTCVICKTERI